MMLFMVGSWCYLREANTCLPKTAPQGFPVPEILALVSLFERLKHLSKRGNTVAR